MITIYGASDDLIEVEGCEGADEFYAANVPLAACWQARLIAPHGDVRDQLSVHAIFDGTWHFALGHVDESLPFPSWPVTFRQGTSEEAKHSVLLEIDAPEGTTIDSIWPAQ